MRLPLFVYGTLMRGGSHDHLVGPARRERASVEGSLWRMPEGYPALTDGDGVVHGEWIEAVDDDVLARLDDYEGVDIGLFERRVVRVRSEDGPFDAWAWTIADPERRGGTRLPGGRWPMSTSD